MRDGMMRHWVPRALAVVLAVGALGGGALVHAQSAPLLGQVMLTAAGYCPVGWLPANGSILDISQHEELYSLYGTMYGGNGQNTFALPDLRGRAPVHLGQTSQGTVLYPGQRVGAEQVQLQASHLPAHSHTLGIAATTNPATHSQPASNRMLAQAQNAGIYADAGGITTPMATQSLSTGAAGGNTPVDIRNPTIVMMWCIATQGMYPTQQ